MTAPPGLLPRWFLMPCSVLASIYIWRVNIPKLNDACERGTRNTWRFSGKRTKRKAASYYETQVEVLRWLQRVLVAQKRFEEALEVAELGRSRALAAIVASRISGTDAAPMAPSVERSRIIAREHGATVVEYSLLYEYDPDLLFIFSDFEDTPVASIYIWVVQPDGKITFRESALPRQGPSLVQLVRQARYLERLIRTGCHE